MLCDGVYNTIEDLAATEKINASYVSRVARLALLAPEIVEEILEGKQAAHLTMKDSWANSALSRGAISARAMRRSSMRMRQAAEDAMQQGGDPIDEHVPNTAGQMRRLLHRATVRIVLPVEHGDIGVASACDAAALAEPEARTVPAGGGAQRFAGRVAAPHQRVLPLRAAPLPARPSRTKST